MPPPEASLVFLPGFMSSAKSYTALLAPLVDAGVAVEVPQLYPRGLGALRGKHSVRQEAADAATLVRELSGPVFLAGHSRGGQAAWLAAGELPRALWALPARPGGWTGSQATTGSLDAGVERVSGSGVDRRRRRLRPLRAGGCQS